MNKLISMHFWVYHFNMDQKDSYSDVQLHWPLSCLLHKHFYMMYVLKCRSSIYDYEFRNIYLLPVENTKCICRFLQLNISTVNCNLQSKWKAECFSILWLYSDLLSKIYVQDETFLPNVASFVKCIYLILAARWNLLDC